MRNFQTWLLANGIKHRHLIDQDTITRAWKLYLIHLFGKNVEARGEGLEAARDVLARVTEANTLASVGQLDTCSVKLLKTLADSVREQPIDQLARDQPPRPNPVFDLGLVQLEAPLPPPPPRSEFWPPANHGRKRDHLADFSKVFVKVDLNALKVFLQPSSGKAQYKSPGLDIPSTSEGCFALCSALLSFRRQLVISSPPVLTELARIVPVSPAAPIYVVSSNRSEWLVKNLKKNTFYGQLIGKRTLIFVVGDHEAKNYARILGQKGQGPADGVFVLSCEGGFGMGWNRHCALLHAKQSNLAGCWMMDDNVMAITESGKPLVDVDDKLLGTPWTVISLYPGIPQQVLGFNLRTQQHALNFCPLFVYSKEDLSLGWILNNVCNEYPQLKQVFSVLKFPKDNIVADLPKGIPQRAKIMEAVASANMWRSSESPHEPLDLTVLLSPHQLMKLQEQAMYDCLFKLSTADRKQLALTWFADMTGWQ